MFKSLNEKELMSVNGGYRYVPIYKFGECVGTAQVANDSNIVCYYYDRHWTSPFSYEWRLVPCTGSLS